MWVGVLFILQSGYIHTATRLHYGVLSGVICDNRFHRLHHSIDSRHFDRNFGVITPLWDVLFHTATFPAPGEWPATGIAEVPEVDGPLDYLTRPFR
jgi:sterol desaturase/sphingolipid hydroxylase (fatty acid hydroxylase superfamily)